MLKWFRKKTKSSPKVLDYSSFDKRHWSHDFSLQAKLDEDGYEWKISVFNKKTPEIGDFILMYLNYDDIRVAIVEKVKSCGNPSDMYFLEINIKGAKEKYEQFIKEKS